MSSFWVNVDVIRTILTVLAIVPFTLFGTAGIWHFSGEHKSGTKLVSIVTILGFVSIVYTLWVQDRIYLWSVLGVLLQSLSVFVFGWSVGASGKRNLSLAFSENCSPKLITDGPYAVVRHPFYTSYILYWIGGVAVAPSIFTVASCLAMIVIYLFESRREDEVLAKLFEGEFPQWYENTGAFFPKWR